MSRSRPARNVQTFAVDHIAVNRQLTGNHAAVDAFSPKAAHVDSADVQTGKTLGDDCCEHQIVYLFGAEQRDGALDVVDLGDKSEEGAVDDPQQTRISPGS